MGKTEPCPLEIGDLIENLAGSYEVGIVLRLEYDDYDVGWLAEVKWAISGVRWLELSWDGMWRKI